MPNIGPGPGAAAGTLTSVTPGTGATNEGKAEDAPHTSGDTGLFVLGVRNSADTGLTSTDLDYSPFSVNGHGDLMVGGRQLTSIDATTAATAIRLKDNNGSSGQLETRPALFNNATYDMQRGNMDTTVGITAAAVTTTQTGTDQTNYNGRGVIVVLDTTVIGTGSVTLSIQGKDVQSGKYYTILSGAAVVTNVTNVYTVYPSMATVANVSISAPLPRTWRVVVTANNANATTYTVGASVLL